MKVETDERHAFGCSPEELWPALTRVDDYRTWWPWLREFDGRAFADGEVWACLVKPPLPYVVRFRLRLHEVDAPRSASAVLSGDIEGTARLGLAATSAGCELRLVSELEPSAPLLRALALLGRPMVRFGHDWVIRTGLRQFESRAL